MEDNLEWKTNKRIKGEISQQPLIGYFSNLMLKLGVPNQNLRMLQIKMTSNGRRPQFLLSGICN